MSANADQVLFDLIVKNAEVYDGESARPRTVDIAITGDRIAQIGELETSQAHHSIDASGLVLTPGFVDAHTHSDFNPLVYPGKSHKILQGVTTEITGNCGMSAAPLHTDRKDIIRSAWAREGVYVKSLPWENFAQYKQQVMKSRVPNNMMMLVGHGNLRFAVMGTEPRTATDEEIKQMQQLLRESMRQGAAGISYGLVYLPGIYADQKEITELCRTAAEQNGVCAFHMRSEGSKLLESIAETIEVSEATGARIQISHLKAAGKANWPKIHEAIHLIQEARNRGLPVYADAYPYTASYAELGVVLPDAYFERQDRTAFFQNPENRKVLLKDLREYYQQKPRDWSRVLIASVSSQEYKKYEGKAVSEIAVEKGESVEEILIDLLAVTQFEVSAFSFSQDQEVVDQVMAASFVMPGSDSIADGTGHPHPRVFGTFPRFLYEYTLKQKSVAIGEAVRRMTSLPAQQFGIPNRGTVKPGYVADLVIWDPFSIQDLADYQNPKRSGKGIRYVILAGKVVVSNGKYAGPDGGSILSSSSAALAV